MCIWGLASRRDLWYNTQVINQSRRVMYYDDYDIDYTYSNDYADLEEYALDARDLDEDYARDEQDYESLAYRHYAW